MYKITLILKYIILTVTFIICGAVYAQNSHETDSTVIYYNKTYHKVKIGNQIWLKENLDVGTMVKGIYEQTNDNRVEKYCLNNDSINCEKYGGLYQWAEAVQYKNGASNLVNANPAFSGNVQGICPSGWHIPTKAEFEMLIKSVNNNGNALKEIGQGINWGIGTNTSGFSALFTGYRVLGTFSYLLIDAVFWSSSESNRSDRAINISLFYNDDNTMMGSDKKDFGFCVRCLKDESVTSVELEKQEKFSTVYTLYQNYPNPFNPTTTITYFIHEPCFVTIKVYDVLGNEIKSLVSEEKSSGNYSIEFDGSNLSSGIYFYQLRIKDFIETKKMQYLR